MPIIQELKYYETVQDLFNDSATKKFVECYETVEDLFNGSLTQECLAQNSNITTKSIVEKSKEKNTEENTRIVENKDYVQQNTQPTILQEIFIPICLQQLYTDEGDNFYEIFFPQKNSIITKTTSNNVCVKKARLSNEQQNSDTEKLQITNNCSKSLQKVTAQNIVLQKNPLQKQSLGKRHCFMFPDQKDKTHRFISISSQKDLQDILKILGPELSIGFLKSKELNELMLHTREIIKDHGCRDFIPSTFVFVNDEFLNMKHKIEEKKISYVVAAFKSKQRVNFHDRNVYVFTTLFNSLDTEKILVVTSPLLNEKGDLRDANIGYSFFVHFYEKIIKCSKHSKCNCYHAHALKNKNVDSCSQEDCGRNKQYKIEQTQDKQEYVENMKSIMISRIINSINSLRTRINLGIVGK